MRNSILLMMCLLLSFSAYSQITSTQNGDWSATTTWAGGSVPGASDAVVIAHDVSCASTQSASTLTVNNGKTLTLTKDGALTVASTVTNNGTIVVTGAENESGSLIATDADSFNLTYNLYIPASEWKLVGIPVSGLTVNDIDDNLATNGSKVGIGFYDSETASWSVFLSSQTAASISQTRGYEMIHATGDVVAFTGALRTSNRSTIATYANKWALLGNPYPSYLRLSDDATDASGTNYFLNATHLSYLKNTHQNVWGWDGSAYDSYSNSNASGGSLDHIAPGDAFWVYGNDEETFTIRETMQVHQGGQGFRNSSAQGSTDDSKPSRLALVKFSVFDENSKRYLSVVFGDDFSIGLDPGEDIGGFRAGDSHIYTQLMDGYNNVDFAIQALPYEKISDITIPLGIETEIGKIRLEFNKNTLPEYIDMYLEDTQENTFKKITDGFEINFDEAYEGLGRFYLHFTDQLIPELPTDDNLRIYKGSDADVMVMGAVGKNYSAKVYDYSGRLIKETNFNHKTKINDLDSKMKILRIESEEGLTIKKFKLN